MKVKGRVYHYLSARVAPKILRSCFLSVYIRDINIMQRENKRAVRMTNLNTQLLWNLTQMLLEVNYYVQNFVALRDWARSVDAPNCSCMIIHSDICLSSEHVSRYNGPQSAEIVAIVAGTQDGILGRQDIAVCRRGQLTQTGAERFNTIPTP